MGFAEIFAKRWTMPGHGLKICKGKNVFVSLRCLKVLELRGCGLRDEGFGTLPCGGLRYMGHKSEALMRHCKAGAFVRCEDRA